MAQQNRYGEIGERRDYHLEGSFSKVLGELDKLHEATSKLKEERSEKEVKEK